MIQNFWISFSVVLILWKVLKSWLAVFPDIRAIKFWRFMEYELQFMTAPTLKVNSFTNGHLTQLLKCDQEIQSLDETSGLRASEPPNLVYPIHPILEVQLPSSRYPSVFFVKTAVLVLQSMFEVQWPSTWWPSFHDVDGAEHPLQIMLEVEPPSNVHSSALCLTPWTAPIFSIRLLLFCLKKGIRGCGWIFQFQ